MTRLFMLLKNVYYLCPIYKTRQICFFCISEPIFLVYLNLQLVVQLILGMLFFVATDLPLLFVHARPDWCFLLLTFRSVLSMCSFFHDHGFYSISNKIFYGSFQFFLNFFFSKISSIVSLNPLASNETDSGKSDRELIYKLMSTFVSAMVISM